MKRLFGLVMLFMFAAIMSHATETLTDTGTAKAKIIEAATFSHVSGALDFGTIIPGTSAGTVTLGAVASPSALDSAEIGGRVTADPVSSDHFTLGHLDTATTYTISVPATVTISNGATGSMVVDLNPSATSVTGVSSADLYVGGVLHVGANQETGAYQNSYTVTVTY